MLPLKKLSTKAARLMPQAPKQEPELSNTILLLEKICDGVILVDAFWNIIAVGDKTRALHQSAGGEIGRNLTRVMDGLPLAPEPYADRGSFIVTFTSLPARAFDASVAVIQTAEAPAYVLALRQKPNEAPQAGRTPALEQPLYIYEQLVETALSGVCIVAVAPCGTYGEIVSVNPAFEQITGYTADLAVGSNPVTLLNIGAESKSIAGELRVKSSLSQFREVTIRNRAGAAIDIDLNLVPIKKEGKVSHFVGFFNDVSKRKKSLQDRVQADRLQALGQLTSNVAHDFNNFLAVIRGNLEMIMAGSDTPRVFAERALRGCQLAADLIKMLAAFSRKQILHPVAVDVVKMTEQLQTMIPGLLEHGTSIGVTRDCETAVIKADAAQLQSCILNLVLNSLDAMPIGGMITLAIADGVLLPEAAIAASENRGEQYVRISVIDTGVGMPEQVRRRALEPFYTTKPVGKGTGLGLSTVFGFVQQSGGAILVESQENVGTTVSLFFPTIRSLA